MTLRLVTSEMESEINKMQTKIPSKSFSIESIVGLKDRRSPDIDIENSISQDYAGHHETSEDEDTKVRDGKLGYYFPQQTRVPNFPFFMSYDKRMLGNGYQGQETGRQGQEDLKRGSSPGSVRSEVDSDGVEERPHGELIFIFYSFF